MHVDAGDARKRLHQVCMIPHKRVDPQNGESPHNPPGGLVEQAARQPTPRGGSVNVLPHHQPTPDVR